MTPLKAYRARCEVRRPNGSHQRLAAGRERACLLHRTIAETISRTLKDVRYGSLRRTIEGVLVFKSTMGSCGEIVDDVVATSGYFLALQVKTEEMV